MHLDTLQGRRDAGRPGRTGRAAGAGHASGARDQARGRRRGMMRRGVAAVAAGRLLPRLRGLRDEPPPKKAAPVADQRAIRIPRPTAAIPARRRSIRGATIFDGEGGRIDNGTIVLADGVVQAVGGPDTPSPPARSRSTARGKWVTPGIIDVHSHLGDYPSPGVDVASATATKRPARSRPEVWAEHSVWPQDPGFSPRARQWRRHRAAGPARLGEPVRRPLGHAEERAGAHGAGDEVPGRALRPQDGLRRESQARLRQQGQMPQTRMGNIAYAAQTWLKAQAYKRKWDKYEQDGGDMPERDLAIDTLRGRAGGQDPRPQPLLPRRRDGDHARYGQGVRLQDRAPSTTPSKLQDRRPAARRTASARRCGPTGGASRWKPMTGSRRISRCVHNAGACAIVHSDDANGIQRLNQEAAKALADGRRLGINITDEVAWTLAELSTRPRRSASPTRPAACKAGKMADVVLWNGNPFSIYTRPDTGVDRRRPAVRRRQSAAAPGQRLRARPAGRRRREVIRSADRRAAARRRSPAGRPDHRHHRRHGRARRRLGADPGRHRRHPRRPHRRRRHRRRRPARARR